MLEFGQDRGGAPTTALSALGSLQVPRRQPWGYIPIPGTPTMASAVPLRWGHTGAGDRNQQQLSSRTWLRKPHHRLGSRHGGVGMTVRLDDLRGLLQPMIL